MVKYVYKEKYDYILSFGSMCSTSLFLRKNGFRSKSCFFDWLTSDFFGNMDAVNHDFEDYFSKRYLIQRFKDYPHLVTNERYGFTYSHVFNPKETFAKQEAKVKARIQRSIDSFKMCLKQNTLLVYYCRSDEEQNRILDSVEIIKTFCKKHKVDLVFIFNNVVSAAFPFLSFVVPYNNVHHPFEDSVSYPIEGEESEKLLKWLGCRYDQKQKEANLRYKHKTPLFVRLKNKIQKNRRNKLII